MAEGKWIADLTAATPIADAARRVLALRLELVRDVLPAAQHRADKDPEHVHQLRVATRSNLDEQNEVLRKMVLGMVEDVRVVLIRLASRTQTLRWCFFCRRCCFPPGSCC